MIESHIFKKLIILQIALLNGFIILYDDKTRLKMDDDYNLCCEVGVIDPKTEDLCISLSKLLIQPDFQFYIKWAEKISEEYFDEICYNLSIENIKIEGVDLIANNY